MHDTTLPKIYAFGPFRLDVAERRLLRDDDPLPLSGKAFDLLQLLVEGAGALQKQTSLMKRLWPDVAVEQNNLQYNVSLVRKALAGAPGVTIQTVRGQGYRLVAEVRDISRMSSAAASTSTSSSTSTAPAPDNASFKAQHMHFAKAHDGARLAYAFLGEGPPLVKAANWLSHLELEREGLLWTHWLDRLTRDHRLIRYDARGNGLSDWNPPSITFADFVADLATIFDAAGIERAPVLGISQGASVAVAYAARHPERVSALILIGGCARGWRVKESARVHERFEAMMALMRQGWGGKNAAFRQLFTTAFFPNATREQAESFNELQRQTASPSNAAAILSALGDVDVREDMARIKAPTLVLHSRDDAVVPMRDGIELASGIPGARFVPLESPNHIWLADEPAWKRFGEEFEAFLKPLRKV